MTTPYEPVFALTRGHIVESVHFGAAAIVDSKGRLLASIGDPQTVTFLRSSAKPFQALPFIEQRGHEKFGMTPKEIALICASHSGTDEHVATVSGLQAKIGVRESDLMCGVHAPSDEETHNALIARGEAPTPYRHNCSGKHTGMLAHARLRNLPIQNYIAPEHPVQASILATFAEMCDLPVDQVKRGIDGCSAPNFAVPLYNAALAYARLCQPDALTPERAAACRTITQAMTTYAFMVAGPGRFDTLLMDAGAGQILSKGGAEGYQALGLLPGASGPDSPGIGVAIKISDGDSQGSLRDGNPSGRARHAVALAILKILGALTETQLEHLSLYGPERTLHNYRNLNVGRSYPIFTLDEHSPIS